MNLYELIFTPSMLIFPIVFVQFYKPLPGAQVDLGQVSRLRLRLRLGTAAALIGYFTLYFLRSTGHMAWWESLPKITTLGMAADKMMWMGFFPLWFAVAMPLLRASRPESFSTFVNQKGEPRQSRSASLAPRATSSSLPNSAGLLFVMLWLTGAGLTAFFLWQRHAQLQAASSPYWILVAVGLSSALIPVFLFPITKRMLGQEAEPMDEKNSPDLTLAYAALRTTKERGFFLFLLVMECLPLAMAVLAVSVQLDSSMVAISGSVVGSLVGIAGAAFGVTMSVRRTQISRMLSELT
ncbi:MAG: hypothetical protein ACI8X5_000186 [Planctomycetota bacterium]|jgi:hypothetical protein